MGWQRKPDTDMKYTGSFALDAEIIEIKDRLGRSIRVWTNPNARMIVEQTLSNSPKPIQTLRSEDGEDAQAHPERRRSDR